MRRDDSGFAMMATVMGVGAIAFLILTIFQTAQGEYREAQFQRRDDTVVVAAEGMLDRYAGKLTIDPLYYRHYVNEAELPRTCTDTSSADYDGLVQPGNAWFDDCTTWDYEDPTGFFQHPLFEGDAAIDADNVAGLFTVTPPTPTESLRVDVVARQGEFGRTPLRSLQRSAPSRSRKFAFLVEESLRFGSGAVITGKIYVGDDLDFRPTPIQGIVHRDVFAEDAIGLRPGYGPPVFDSGSVGYDSRGVYLDIDAVYPEPLDFTNFWDDLALIKDVSCSGAGLCLSHTLNPSLGLASYPTAWLIEPQVAGGVGRLRVSAAYSNSSSGCVSSEEWWWLNYDTAGRGISSAHSTSRPAAPCGPTTTS